MGNNLTHFYCPCLLVTWRSILVYWRSERPYKEPEVKHLDRWPELGVRFIDRHIEKENYSGRTSVVETVAEYKGSWEGREVIYRYAIHWTVDDEALEIQRYDKFAANEAAENAIGLNRRISIPSELLNKMCSMAEQFLYTEGVREELSFLHEIKLERDPQNHDHIIATFRTRRWSGYRMVFREHEGHVQLIESVNRRILSGDRAQGGHKRIPQILCRATFALVSDYIRGQYVSKGNRQGELDLILNASE